MCDSTVWFEYFCEGSDTQSIHVIVFSNHCLVFYGLQGAYDVGCGIALLADCV